MPTQDFESKKFMWSFQNYALIFRKRSNLLQKRNGFLTVCFI